MAKPRVLVTRKWPDRVEAEIAKQYDATFNASDRQLGVSELRDALGSYDAILPTVSDRLLAETLDTPRVQTKLLANYGVGYSHIDVATARHQGMTITNTPDVLSECTADLTMTLLLMVARRASEGERELRSGTWKGPSPIHMMGTKVSGKTLGIVGYGRIGREVARRAHHGFGMDVLVFNRSPVDQAVLKQNNAVQMNSLEELLPQCDFVSLHCPGGASTRNLINAARLDLMRENAILVNTARGSIVNETALAQALMFDTIGGVGLDVYSEEPCIPPALAECDNLVMLPHLGSATHESREAMGFRVLENLNDFFQGKSPRDLVA